MSFRVVDWIVVFRESLCIIGEEVGGVGVARGRARLASKKTGFDDEGIEMCDSSIGHSSSSGFRSVIGPGVTADIRQSIFLHNRKRFICRVSLHDGLTTAPGTGE